MSEIKRKNDDDDIEIGSSELNFRDSNGIYYIHGKIDESIPKNIIAPLVNDIEQRKLLIKPLPIKFFITSFGGQASPSFDIINLFEYARSVNIEIYTYVTSHAMSAASMIACAGHKRFVGKRACHMLHFAKSVDYSSNPIMSDRNNENLKLLQDEMIALYVKYSKGKLKEKQLRAELLPDSFYINGSEAIIRSGLADEEF